MLKVMEKELSKSLMCIQMRGGAEIWEEKENIVKLQRILETITSSRFVSFGDQTINTADIIGIFNAGIMEGITKRKNGEWKCRYENWHQRGERCFCGEMKKYENK